MMFEEFSENEHPQDTTGDGARINAAFDGRIVVDEKGGFPKTHCTLSDVTERNRMEEALKTSEVKYHFLMDNTPAALSVVQEGKIIFANSRMEEITGYSFEELRNIKDFAFVHHEDRERVIELHRLRMQGKQVPNAYSLRMIKKDGTVIWLRRRAVVIDWEGTPAALVMDIDITDRKQAEDSLQQSEMRLLRSETELKRAQRTAHMGSWVWHVKTDSLEWSDEMYHIFGIEKDEFSGNLTDVIAKAIHPEDRAAVEAANLAVIKDKKPAPMEYRVVLPNGSIRIIWAEAGELVLDGSGKPDSLHGFVQDITERKKADEELRANQHFIQRLLDGTPNLTYVYDLVEHRNVYANREVQDFLGYTAEQVQAMGSSLFAQILHPDDAAVVADHHARCATAADQDVLEITYRMKHSDGQWRWLRSKDVAFKRDNQGSVTEILGATEDITDRKLAEEKIKRSSLEWRTTFDAISEMISIQDRDFKILRINKAYADALGMPIKEVVGKTCYECVHCSNTPVADCPHQQTMKSGKPATLEIKNEAKGTYSEIYTYPIFDESGNVTSTVHVVHDVTARKKAEQEARQLREKAEMSSRLASIGEMAAGIAHEINNPLTGVIGFSELLIQRNDLPEDAREELKIINDGSQRVKEIIRRMLTFARQTKPQKNDINLNEIIENTLELRSYVLRTANIELVNDFDPDLPEVFGDSGQMQQVFLNLIVNAEYAMKKAHGRGKLTIKTERVEDCVRISVQDDGPGLSSETMIKLFQPFYTTKPPGEGTGLGLALSLGIVKEHSGTITAKSAPGQGATFVIELPITTGDKQVDVEEVSPEIKTPVKKATVLVIDDEPSVRSLVQVMLTQNGHIVDESASFDKALEQVAARAYDLIFMDIRMPGMSGTELYTEVTNRWPELVGRIVFITGDTSDQAIREYLTQHEVPYLSKPFDHKKLENMVAAVLQRRR